MIKDIDGDYNRGRYNDPITGKDIDGDININQPSFN